eukprot:scaffold1032_cov223-Pinguiococcus_pyrenoidosus.AAC.2
MPSTATSAVASSSTPSASSGICSTAQAARPRRTPSLESRSSRKNARDRSRRPRVTLDASRGCMSTPASTYTAALRCRSGSAASSRSQRPIRWHTTALTADFSGAFSSSRACTSSMKPSKASRKASARCRRRCSRWRAPLPCRSVRRAAEGAERDMSRSSGRPRRRRHRLALETGVPGEARGHPKFPGALRRFRDARGDASAGQRREGVAVPPPRKLLASAESHGPRAPDPVPPAPQLGRAGRRARGHPRGGLRLLRHARGGAGDPRLVRPPPRRPSPWPLTPPRQRRLLPQDGAAGGGLQGSRRAGVPQQRGQARAVRRAAGRGRGAALTAAVARGGGRRRGPPGWGPSEAVAVARGGGPAALRRLQRPGLRAAWRVRCAGGDLPAFPGGPFRERGGDGGFAVYGGDRGGARGEDRGGEGWHAGGQPADHAASAARPQRGRAGPVDHAGLSAAGLRERGAGAALQALLLAGIPPGGLPPRQREPAGQALAGAALLPGRRRAAAQVRDPPPRQPGRGRVRHDQQPVARLRGAESGAAAAGEGERRPGAAAALGSQAGEAEEARA